ncbi:MAG: cobalamin biosynthesis protein [Alphaproteobacteria bacterium]|nr:cobalamin biosynthesis protein [Alphaproteobacteria bacterium]
MDYTILTQWHAQLMDAERIPPAVAAILLTMVVGIVTGPVAGNANPFFWLALDKLFGPAGDRLNKPHRPRADLMFRGLILTAAAVFLAVYTGKGFEALAGYGRSAGDALEIICLSLLITSGTVWFSLLKLYFAMERGGLGKGAYYALARSSRLDFSGSDDYGITRAAMGFAVRSFDKGLVAPVLWYLILGFPGAAAYAALAALSWRFGQDGFTKGFGAVPLALERLVGFVPSLFAAVFVMLAGLFTPTAKLHQGLAAWLGHKNRAPYAQGGFPVSALAWSLKVSLGGPVRALEGGARKADWIGPDDATAQNDHRHLRRALYINVTAHILFLASLLGAYLWA